MGKRILRVYLAKNDTPYSAAYAKLELPASPWEVWDAMEKVRLQTDDILYIEIDHIKILHCFVIDISHLPRPHYTYCQRCTHSIVSYAILLIC